VIASQVVDTTYMVFDRLFRGARGRGVEFQVIHPGGRQLQQKMRPFKGLPFLRKQIDQFVRVAQVRAISVCCDVTASHSSSLDRHPPPPTSPQLLEGRTCDPRGVDTSVSAVMTVDQHADPSRAAQQQRDARQYAQAAASTARDSPLTAGGFLTLTDQHSRPRG